MWKIFKLKVKKPNRFGWIPDKKDDRDLQIKLTVRRIPSSIDLRSTDSPIYDQEDLGSCTANAIGGLYEFVHIKQNHGVFTPSRLFIYYNERVIEGSVNSDDGAMIRDGMKSIGTGDKGYGMCSEKLWPYITSRFKNKPCCKCYAEALKDQALEYMTVQQSPVQLKTCLADGFPFVFGFTVYSSFMNIDSNGHMVMPQPNDQVEGGHAVMCVGYDDIKKSYIVRNSWGSSWGDGGYFYMPYDYMHNKDLCDDFWTIRLSE